MFGAPVTSPRFALIFALLIDLLGLVCSICSTKSCFCVLAPPLFPVRHWNLTLTCLAHMSGLRHIALMLNLVCQTLWPLDWAWSPGCSAASIWALSWCWMNQAEPPRFESASETLFLSQVGFLQLLQVKAEEPNANNSSNRTEPRLEQPREHAGTTTSACQVNMKWKSTLFCKCMLLILLGMIHAFNLSKRYETIF